MKKANAKKGKQPKQSKPKAKIPISSVAKAVARFMGAGGIADGLIDSGVSALADFTNLPFGIRQRGGSKIPYSSVSRKSAPSSIGFAMRTPDWDFQRAPDIGMGPGIRLTGRYLLGHIIDMWNNNATPPRGNIGFWPKPGGSKAWNAFLLSPASSFNGDNITAPEGCFGSYDSVHQDVCECFTRYRVVDAVIEYVPSCPSTIPSTVTVAWLADPEVAYNMILNQTQGTGSAIFNVPLANPDEIMNIPDAFTTSAWMPAKMRLPLDGKGKDLLFVNSQGFDPPPIDPDTGGPEETRFLFPGAILVTGTNSINSDTPSTNPGMLFLNITMDVYQLALNAEPAFVPGVTDSSRSDSKCGSSMSTDDAPLSILGNHENIGHEHFAGQPMPAMLSVETKKVLLSEKPKTVFRKRAPSRFRRPKGTQMVLTTQHREYLESMAAKAVQNKPSCVETKTELAQPPDTPSVDGRETEIMRDHFVVLNNSSLKRKAVSNPLVRVVAPA